MTLAIAAAMLLGACSGEAGCADAGRRTGVVTDITSEGIGRVESFELKSGDETHEILIDPGVEYDFDLGHLHEHLASSDPVVVDLEERDGALYALTIEDA
jgi:hypothetical protein